MKGIRTCPYCNGEVEMVKLVKRKNESHSVYRIQCLSCKALVARGTKFPTETEKEGKERIKQYKEVIKEKMEPLHIQRIKIANKEKAHSYGYSAEL